MVCPNRFRGRKLRDTTESDLGARPLGFGGGRDGE
jgi:hypothetical protein